MGYRPACGAAAAAIPRRLLSVFWRAALARDCCVVLVFARSFWGTFRAAFFTLSLPCDRSGAGDPYRQERKPRVCSDQRRQAWPQRGPGGGGRVARRIAVECTPFTVHSADSSTQGRSHTEGPTQCLGHSAARIEAEEHNTESAAAAAAAATAAEQ